MRKRKINFDKIIEKILENESIGKNLTDSEFLKVIDFVKNHLFIFLLKLYKIKYSNIFISQNELEDRLFNFCMDLIRKFEHDKVDSQIEILTNLFELSDKYFL